MSDMSRTGMEEAPARARRGTCRKAWGWVKTLLTVRLVLAVVPLFYTLDAGQWLELPIQCSWNVVCYYNVFQKVVVKSLGESAFFPTSKCLMKHWRHAVKDTQARETNIISVCSLNFACWNDVCPNLTQVSWKTLPSFRSCLLYGPQNDHCGTESVPITVADVDSTCWMPSGSSPTTVEFKESLKRSRSTKRFLSTLYQSHCSLDPEKREHIEAFLAKEVQIMDEDKDGYVTREECESYVRNHVVHENKALLLSNPGEATPELCNAFARFGSFETERVNGTCGYDFEVQAPSDQHGRWLLDMPLASAENRTEAIHTYLQPDRDSEGNYMSYQKRIVFLISLQGGLLTEDAQTAIKTLLELTHTFGVILEGGSMLEYDAKETTERVISQLSEHIHIYWFAFGDDDGLWDYMKSLPSVDEEEVQEWNKKEIAEIKHDVKQCQVQLQHLQNEHHQLYRQYLADVRTLRDDLDELHRRQEVEREGLRSEMMQLKHKGIQHSREFQQVRKKLDQLHKLEEEHMRFSNTFPR